MNTAGLALFGVALRGGLSGAAVLGLAAGLMLVTSVALADAALRIIARHRAQRRLPAALTDLGPTFLLHFYAPHGSEHQVLMWLPYLDRLGHPYVHRAPQPGDLLRDQRGRPSRPVLLCRYAVELDAGGRDSCGRPST